MPLSAFKEQVQKDFQDMLNQSVFGLTINWEGTDTICALVASTPKEFDPRTSLKEPGGELTKSISYIFRRTEMPTAPTVGSSVKIDGKRWTVQGVSEQISHIVVNLTRSEA